MPPPASICFSIDRGGTFTDVYGTIPEQDIVYTENLLSSDPANYPDAPREGIRRILERHLQKILSPSSPLGTTGIRWIRMGTTVATNALLERKGADTALVISKGFADLLAIGDQTRPDLFDLAIRKPDQLYKTVLEVDERIRLVQPGEKVDPKHTITGTSGERFLVLARPDKKSIYQGLKKIYADGIRSVAIVCIHGYAVYDHELLIGKIATEIGFSQISLSHRIMPQVKIVARGDTTLVDAYLSPHIHQYLLSFKAGFKDGLRNTPLLFMQSDGGLTVAERFKGSNAILSGPAGGVVGCGSSAYPETGKRPVIGFDMGGTSTDVSRFNGACELTQETVIAGVRIQAPQMHIKTVAAGGGSRLFYRKCMLQVGPESAGAHPGPVCYRKKGHLSITDANLFLGRIQADYFPHIFGPDEDQPLDLQSVRTAFRDLTRRINSDYGKQGLPPKSPEEIALGFLEVGNETMIRPIREISVMRGYDIKEHVFSCFSGAGGQHGCSIAAKLGMRTVFIHRYGGLLSAIGISQAQIVVDRQETAAEPLTSQSLPHLNARLLELETKSLLEFEQQCSDKHAVEIHHSLNLRFQGSDSAMMIPVINKTDPTNSFLNKYRQEFGFLLKDRDILVDDIRVRISGSAPSAPRQTLPDPDGSLATDVVRCYFKQGWLQTPVYLLEKICQDTSIPGPALIIQDGSTILVEPGAHARRNQYGDILIELGLNSTERVTTAMDPIQLSIFSNLFMSIGEQMGRTLQKTAISTNIKERLDFSCAVFDNHGDLVANAPHIPVHLGAMGEAIKKQIHIHGNTLEQRDVLLSNHPAAGGSHLPDLTIITPVWHNEQIVFYVASRGHHADIGGITPGSMPPFSKTLAEEGAAIISIKVVSKEEFQEQQIVAVLSDFADPSHTPPIAAARHIADNIADIKAQIAANRSGIRLLHEIIAKYGLDVVEAYMKHIQTNAEQTVRAMLVELCHKRGIKDTLKLYSEDFLDDSTAIRLSISLSAKTGDALFDFRKSGSQLPGNLNCPRAVVQSAILYCLRCLIGEDIPLNQGCLNPITIRTASNSLLTPDQEAAVVGGNVLTSQRITDVIFKAFAAAADSQGCTNNLTFGNESFGYYETIGGGAGAGPGWHGRSGVHTHMTNTRITDPEILERRYPVLLKTFSFRKNSGGAGEYRGGDGLIREIQALTPLQVSILSERRNYPPNGILGGENGKCGKNYLVLDNCTTEIGGKNSISLQAGDAIRIETPGGGGFGTRKFSSTT